MAPVLPTDEERQLLRESVRGFLAGHWPAAAAVVQAAGGGELTRIWRSLAAQGLTALGGNPEEGGLREICIDGGTWTGGLPGAGAGVVAVQPRTRFRMPG